MAAATAMTEPPAAAAAPDVARPLPPVSRRTAAAISAAAALMFVLLTVWAAAHGQTPPSIDEHLHRWVVAHRGPASVAVARDVRWAGVSWIVLPALIVIGVAAARPGSRTRRDRGERLGAGLLLSLAASTGVYAEIFCNKMIGRSRPPVTDWAGAAGGASFPSGHTTTASMFALAAAWALAASVRPGWRRRAIWAGAGVYAVTVGWSRVWLGVHWPTDVAGGWLFSLAWLAGGAALISSTPGWLAGRWPNRPRSAGPDVAAEPASPDASPAGERRP
jgi:membrane-associated phospholipid phosphatase